MSTLAVSPGWLARRPGTSRPPDARAGRPCAGSARVVPIPARSPAVRRSDGRRPVPLLRARADGDDDGPVASTPPTDGNVDARNPRVGASEDADAADAPVNLVDEFKRGVAFGTSMKERFTQARIDDRGLPIADALVVTTVPVFVATVVLALGIPRPSWLVPAPWVPRWRSLQYVAPALSHGAKLAACWIPGALAARAYEREAYDGTVDEAVRRTVKGGCFAVGVLVLLTQASLTLKFASMGMAPPQLGDSPETDLVLNGAASELIADAAFEAAALIAWRIVRCKSDIPPDDPPPWG